MKNLNTMIKKSFIIIMIAIVGLFFASCSQKFSRHNKAVGFKNGVPYHVPYEAYYSLIENKGEQGLLNNKRCNVNDVYWIEREFFDEQKETYSKEMQNTIGINVDIFKKAYIKGLAGCVSPMSDREFQYATGNQRQRAQMQHEQNIQSQKNLNKTLDRQNNTTNSMRRKKHDVTIYNY